MAPEIHDPSHLFIKVRNPVTLGTDVPLLSKSNPCLSKLNSRCSTPRFSDHSSIHLNRLGNISLASIHSSTSSTTSKRSKVLAKPEAPSSTRLSLSAKFVNDMNIPDGTSLQAGRVIRKVNIHQQQPMLKVNTNALYYCRCGRCSMMAVMYGPMVPCFNLFLAMILICYEPPTRPCQPPNLDPLSLSLP